MSRLAMPFMRVALVTVYSHPGCTLKDVAGGYGTVFEVGKTLRARLLERAKARLADLPPLVLGYLAAQVRALGHEVSVHELRGSSPALPDVDLAIVLSSLVDAQAERRTLERLRSAGIRTLVVGAYASARPETYEAVADAVVIGEPEALGRRLLEADGLTSAGQVDDLDALPFPDWDGFDVPRYRYAFLSRRTSTLPVGSARGCAYGCGYCPWRATARFRERDPANVGAEVAHLRERWGVRAVAFRDPLFNLHPERVQALAEQLRPLDVRFSAEMRADRLDESLLLNLWRAGLRSLEIGVESVNRRMLVEEKRRPPAAFQVARVVEVAQRLGIRVICNYVLGLPGDDEASIRATVEWAKQLNSFAVQFTIATPYPGTTLEPRVRDRMLPVTESDHTGFRPTFRHDRMSPELLQELREWAYLTYHFRPRYAWRFARHAAEAMWD